MANWSGGASVVGYIYKVGGAAGAVPFSFNEPAALGDTDNTAMYVVALEAVDEELLCRVVPLRPGDTVDIYCDAAVGLTSWICLPAGGIGTVGQGDVEAAHVANRAIGVPMEATGGAGLCSVMIWAPHD